MSLLKFVILNFLITKLLSQTCSNSGNSFRDVRFNQTTYSYCYHLPTSDCSSTDVGNYVASVNQTCDLLDVTAQQVGHTILTTSDYRGSERCGCLTRYGGSLVIIVDANPLYVNDAMWKYRIIHTLDWFYHFISRRTGPAISITYLFAHGSTYYEVSDGEIYDDFRNITQNPYIDNATVSQTVTQPCGAINRALTILNSLQDPNSHRWLFYWGFSTPSLLSCTPYNFRFAHVATYAIRQTQSVDLSSIESLYGDFSECNWYIVGETTPTESQAIQDRAIVGTLSDFLCARTLGQAVLVTAAPTPIPTPTPTTAAPTPSPTTPSPTTPSPTTAAPTTAAPTTAAPTTAAPTTAAPTTAAPTTAAPTTAAPTTAAPTTAAPTTAAPTTAAPTTAAPTTRAPTTSIPQQLTTTPAPITPAPTARPTKRPTTRPTTAQPSSYTNQPSSEPTARNWWSSNYWSSKHRSKHHRHHHHSRKWY